MIFTPAKISGMFEISLEPRVDDRGYFSRVFCQNEYTKAGIDFKMVQMNQAKTKAAGVLRGMHWQVAPKLEAKVFRCIQGKVYDVVADVRPDSPTFGKWVGYELSGDELKTLYIPGGVAHGYETLTPDCVVQYLVDEFYSPESEHGFRWDDPVFKIKWPLPPSFMSEKDSHLPEFKT
jgi:dTDP-4-dehydrorhamnose 3,5-epimerase